MAAGARQAGPGAAVLALLAAWLALAGSPGEQRSRVWVLSAANWSLVLQGQWMVQFYAPWCPACQQIEAAWENFAKESEHLDTTVGKVDVTQEPGLSGRFFVTTLPTIYHAKDGVFRRYRGSRTSDDLQSYILERKWEAVEPVAGWKSPSSIMMHGMAGLFHFSGWIRQIHSYFTGTLGIHVWGSYAIFILATLLIGLILGLILVLIADCLCPSKSRYREEASELIEKENAELTAVEEVEETEELSENELEEAAEEKEDISGGEDGAKSSEEANSSEDGSEEDSAVEEGSGTEETEDICEQHPIDSETQSSVRQRKSQVADNGL
ncbi:thioredoxin-related transmembrane protein 4 isoform 2-T2 [Macrochelys suwanniensis]